MKIIVKEEAKEIVGKINWTAYFPDDENIVLGKEDCQKLSKYIEYLERIEDEDLHKYNEVYEEDSKIGEEDGDN